MKTEIKNFLKSNLLGLISLILILSGGTYAAWDSTKSTGSVITASEWNSMTSYIKDIPTVDLTRPKHCGSGSAFYIKNVGIFIGQHLVGNTRRFVCEFNKVTHRNMSNDNLGYAGEPCWCL